RQIRWPDRDQSASRRTRPARSVARGHPGRRQGGLSPLGDLPHPDGAARRVSGEVLMYADRVTGSMKEALAETDRRRVVQAEYNRANGITPESIKKSIRELLETVPERDYYTVDAPRAAAPQWESPAALARHVEALEKEMKEGAKPLDFGRGD